MKVLFGVILLVLNIASSFNKPYQCINEAIKKGPCLSPPKFGAPEIWPSVNDPKYNFSGRKAVTIGLLTTLDPHNCANIELRFNMWFLYKKVAAAVQLAFERVNAYNFLGKYDRYMQYYWIDDKCHDGRSVLIAVDLISKFGIRALIGPTMNTQVGPVSRHASFHNIPLITAGGLNEHFDDKSQEDYRTVIRMQDGYQELGNFIKAFFDDLRWSKIPRQETNDFQNLLAYESWEKLDGGKARTEALFMCGALDIQLNRRSKDDALYRSDGYRISKEKVKDNVTYIQLLEHIKKNTRGIALVCCIAGPLFVFSTRPFPAFVLFFFSYGHSHPTRQAAAPLRICPPRCPDFQHRPVSRGRSAPQSHFSSQ